MHKYGRHKNEEGYEPQPCARCGEVHDYSQHHIWPRRYAFKQDYQDFCVWLCWPCHAELEEIIEKHEIQFTNDHSRRHKLPNWWYPFIVLKFVTDDNFNLMEEPR